jgi:RimJ/RimL family protein N-acetyltransferase
VITACASTVEPGPATSLTIPALETERLVLRAFRSDDLEPFARIVSDPDVVRYIDDGTAISREACWRGMALFLGHWVLRGFGWWAVEEKATGRFLGRLGLWDPEGSLGMELGWLLDKSYWGMGLATEGATAALRYAFDVLGRDQVLSIIRPGNTRSIRVAEKLGATFQTRVDLRGGPASVYVIRDRRTV